MGCGRTRCAWSTPPGTELHWPVNTPLAIGVFTLCVGLVVALERHEFTSPNLGLLLIIVIVLPWLIDLVGWPQQIMRKDARVQYPVVALWSAVVLGFVYWLSVSFYVANTDFAPFFLVLLIGEMAATVSPPFGAAVLAAGLAVLLVLTVVNHFAWEGQVIWAFAFGIGWLGGHRLPQPAGRSPPSSPTRRPSWPTRRRRRSATGWPARSTT